MYCATITFIQADMKVVRVYFLIVMHELMLIINDGDWTVHIFIRIATVKRPVTLNVGEDVVQLDFSYITDGDRNGTAS